MVAVPGVTGTTRVGGRSRNSWQAARITPPCTTARRSPSVRRSQSRIRRRRAPDAAGVEQLLEHHRRVGEIEHVDRMHAGLLLRLKAGDLPDRAHAEADQVDAGISGFERVSTCATRLDSENTVTLPSITASGTSSSGLRIQILPPGDARQPDDRGEHGRSQESALQRQRCRSAFPDPRGTGLQAAEKTP